MLKILTKEQVFRLDQATIQEEKISSTKLMERASLVFTDWLLEMFQRKAKTIYIFCGKGNNGGDGLVISRLLAEKGWRVFCYIISSSKEPSQDFQINYKKLQNGLQVNLFAMNISLWKVVILQEQGLTPIAKETLLEELTRLLNSKVSFLLIF